MDDALRRRVCAYLEDCHVMTLATHGSEGLWAAAVFYVNDELRALHFVSSPRSRHCINLADNARVCATVQKDYDDWTQIRGVQLEGRAEEVPASEREHVRRRYASRFPMIGGKAPAAIAEALTRVSWYSVVPERCWFVDNSRGFGHRDEVVLAPPRKSSSPDQLSRG